jgi:hypothetical protein
MTDFKVLSADLIASSDAEFHRFVFGSNFAPDAQMALFIAFLESLEQSSTLINSEKERRLTELFARCNLPFSALRTIALSVREIRNPTLRNAIARLLPADLRPLISAKQPKPNPDFQPKTLSLVNDKKLKLQEIVETPFELSNEAADVVFLSLDEDPASAKLLKNRGFTALRYSTKEEVETILETNDDICAVIVEDSFLAIISKPEQAQLLSRLAAYSTFIWLKISETNLHLERDEVFDVIARARCTSNEPSLGHVFLGDRPGIQERDLASIEKCRDSLARDKSPSLFIPGEINEEELRLLVAALTDFVHRKRFRLKASVTSIKTRFIQSGRSDDAKVAIVRVNELRFPIVVKVASGKSREIIKEEATRFCTFIQAGDKDLTPEVHLHGRSALMIFGLIESGEDDFEPAPTLDEVLKSFWLSEMYDNNLNKEHILKGFNRALRKVTELNKLNYQEHGFECRANPYLEDLKKMELRGFNWGFGNDALEKRKQSEELIQLVSQKAVAQGDLHTRNILLRGENGFLIDYAYSGPGHPCTDLVRLELSLFFNYFTPFVSEDVLIDFQKNFTFHRLSAIQLIEKYPAAFQSATNRLCIEMCVAARDSLGIVLRTHKLDWEHYYAIKRLAAWQALQVPPLQRSLVRLIIDAI